jgi:hypothetical protein
VKDKTNYQTKLKDKDKERESHEKHTAPTAIQYKGHDKIDGRGSKSLKESFFIS